MRRTARHCFWLRLAVIAAAAAFMKADAHGLYADHPAAGEVSAGSRTIVGESEKNPQPEDGGSGKPVDEDRTSGSGASFIAVRPDMQDLNGGSLRRLSPREPVSGLHQPVTTAQAARHPALAKGERPTEPDLIRVTARPIVRHGPPLS